MEIELSCGNSNGVSNPFQSCPLICQYNNLYIFSLLCLCCSEPLLPLRETRLVMNSVKNFARFFTLLFMIYNICHGSKPKDVAVEGAMSRTNPEFDVVAISVIL